MVSDVPSQLHAPQSGNARRTRMPTGAALARRGFTKFHIPAAEHDGKPAFAVVPIGLWKRVRERVEDAEAVAAYDRAVAKEDGFTIPAVVLRAELDGRHPVRAWREHRGLTLQALADAAGVSKPYVSQIEGGKRAGTAATLKKLAKVLRVPLDALQP